MALNAHIQVKDHEALATLCLLKRLKFRPQVVIDVGAAVGEWSLVCSRVFPHAKYFMYDANPKALPLLHDAAAQMKRGYAWTKLFANTDRELAFAAMGYGSSVYPEDTHFRREVSVIKAEYLGDLAPKFPPGPRILKVDAQGSELDILKGADDVLFNSDVVFIEASLLPYNVGAPLFHEIVRYLAQHNFLLWDLGKDKFARPDGVPFQINATFVPKDSPLRARKPYWAVEEHQEIDTAYLPIKIMPEIDRYVEEHAR